MALGSSMDARRSAWIVSERASAEIDLEDAVLAAGLRPVRKFTLTDAEAELRHRPHGTLLVVDVGPDEAAGEEALLSRIEVEAGWRGQSAVICFAQEALDRVAARISAPFATLLCEPSMLERVAAIGFASAESSVTLQEIDSVRDTARLHQLADEVARIARALAGASDDSRQTVSDGLIGYRAGSSDLRFAQSQIVRPGDIRTMIRLRRQREALFPADMFADPAWDMMLDLMAARIERIKVAVSSLCIAAAVPPTTALRWIRTMTDLGIFVRVTDPTDGRRVFIELSDSAASKLLEFLGDTKRQGVSIV